MVVCDDDPERNERKYPDLHNLQILQDFSDLSDRVMKDSIETYSYDMPLRALNSLSLFYSGLRGFNTNACVR